MSDLPFSREDIEAVKRTMRIVDHAMTAYPYDESVTPHDIRGHTLLRGDVTLSYKESK